MYTVVLKSRKENPQKLTQLSSRSHPRVHSILLKILLKLSVPVKFSVRVSELRFSVPSTQLGCIEMGPPFKISSERPERCGIFSNILFVQIDG